MKSYLEPKFFRQKSFYNRAFTITENGKILLYSDGVLVAQVDEKKDMIIFYSDIIFKCTTIRHMKEFYYQNVDNKKTLYNSDLQNILIKSDRKIKEMK